MRSSPWFPVPRKPEGHLGNLASYRSIVAQYAPRSILRRGRVHLVDAMMIDRTYFRSRPGQSKNGLHGPANRIFGSLLGVLLIPVLCQCSQGPPPAPASSFEFSAQQATATMATLRGLAIESPVKPEVSMELLPDDGIRWKRSKMP